MLQLRHIAAFLVLSALAVPSPGEAPFGVDLNSYTRLGARFTADAPFNELLVALPSWDDSEGGLTLALWDSPARAKQLARAVFAGTADNAVVILAAPTTLPAGTYYFEGSHRTGQTKIGFYALHQTPSDDCMIADGQPQRELQLKFELKRCDSPYRLPGPRRSWTHRQNAGAASAEPVTVPQWIWYPESPIADDTRYFRRDVDLPVLPAKAVLRTVGDDVYTAYFNGKQIASGGQPNIVETDVTALLRPGRNAVAADDTNYAPPGGFLAELILTAADGTVQRIFSDSNWRSATHEQPGWREPEFDDSDWPAAVVVDDVYNTTWYGRGNLAKLYPYPESANPAKLLAGEKPLLAQVKVERGGPRLFVNGRETYPLAAWSSDLAEFQSDFNAAGIHLTMPLISLGDFWRPDREPDWSAADAQLAMLLAHDHESRFLIRTMISLPAEWVKLHPSEAIVYGRSTQGDDGAFSGIDHGSWASPLWRRDADVLLTAFLRHLEASPFASRIVGYQIANGIYGEWHHFGARYLPDQSNAMARAVGGVPSVDRRTMTTFGLLRDPSTERDVIDYYRRFHALCADTIVHFAHLTKVETHRRCLVGAFYTYLLENIWIQEAGHLAPERVLACPDIDFVASPYTYAGEVTDNEGNALGRARGVGGDGGYRVLLESVKRHGKLYFAEMDPSSNLETQPRIEGGPGSETTEGSAKVIRRDAANMLALGNAGWWFDIGPGWLADKPFLDEMRAVAALGEQRKTWNLGSPAQIAAVYDPKAFCATQHWTQNNGHNQDLFNEQFLDNQARAINRLGAPVDFLDVHDLRPGDAKRYRLIFMVNTFCADSAEVARLQRIFAGSGATVVWFYAPGLIAPDKLDLAQMSRLTGFSFDLLTTPGPLSLQEGERRFGSAGSYWPRFAVKGNSTPLATWPDTGLVGAAKRSVGGWTSVYYGAAPLPVETLARLANEAGVRRWSDQADVVHATNGCVEVIATSDGPRRIMLPRAMKRWQSEGKASRVFAVDAKMGDVTVFVTGTKR